MAGKPKPTARQAFDDNIADAEQLVLLAEALQNRRRRRMRLEKRQRLGDALDIAKKHWDELDCIESEDLFAIFPPGSRLGREAFEVQALRPLLRQALVAACAALETFVGDRVVERLSSAINVDEKPSRLLQLPMTVDDWLRIDRQYKRKRWGLRQVAELEIRRVASPAPAQIGIAFSIIGEKGLWKKIDQRRKVSLGNSEKTLDELNARRNRIAHNGDRLGVGRATISSDEVRKDLHLLVDIVGAMDQVT
jgi:hypothetical protein